MMTHATRTRSHKDAKTQGHKSKRVTCGLVAFGLLGGLFLFFSIIPSAFANILGNSNFETSLGNGSENNWQQNFDNPCSGSDPAAWPAACVFLPDLWSNATLITNGYTASSGTQALHLKAYYSHPLPTPNFYRNSYTFQANNSIKAGDFVTFSAKAQTDIKSTEIFGGSIAIEFKDESDVKIAEQVTSGIKIIPSVWSGKTWRTFSAQAVAPAGTKKIVFVLKADGISGGSGTYGNVLFSDANAEVNPAKLTVSASKRNVAPGDAVGINAHYTNAFGSALTDVEMRVKIPHGFDYAAKSVRVNGDSPVYREGFLIIHVPDMAAGDEYSTSFVTLVTSGVKLGTEYSMEFTIVGSIAGGSGAVEDLSDTVTLKFLTQGDPVFDQGTIIGKVFNDLNQNGVQDKGEEGVPWVRLYTEEGIGIVTDENGLYHVPGVTSGRHVVKIDGHSLPDETKFITEEAYLVKTTPGLMTKANFAVLLPPSGIPENFKKDLSVMVTQGVDVSRPTLDVQISPDVVKLGVGVLEKEPAFTFDNNYGKFIKKWTVEVRDEMGQPVWIGYGVGMPPPEVTWSGITESGLLIKPGIYSYQLKVRDAKNREDWTALKFFEVMTKMDPKAKPNYHPEIPPIGDFNLFKDGKQSIPLVAKPVVRVQGKTQPKNMIKINDTPVAVDAESGMFQKEFFVEPGEYTVAISATTPEGETTSFNKQIKVKDSTFFMVALGEEQLGLNEASGAMEAAESDAYRDGFRQDGRFSFFLKGKLKGKFLVKAKYDTSDRRTALFTNLNPNDYYPIYGDNSTRDYQAQDTAQRLFVLVEMDRSYAQWGSFKTEFTDTELATYNRTLSGLKVNFDTVSSTVYGDPKRGFKVFSADSDHRADHNELYATGGSLFYTRNRNIVEGSEKIRVEIRDKIQNMTVDSYDLQEGTDYEINYGDGRILLSRPLSSVAAADTLTSTDILDGSPVY